MVRMRNSKFRLKILFMLLCMTLLMTLIIRNRYLKDDQFFSDIQLNGGGAVDDSMNYFMNDKINLEMDNDDYKNDPHQQLFDQDLNIIENELDSDIEYLQEEKKKYHNLIKQMSKKDSVKYKSFEKRARNSKSKSDFLILEYTKVFSQPKFCDKSSQDIFNSNMEKCEYKNCRYTCERDSLKLADALIFHQRDLETELISKYSTNVFSWLENTEQIPFKGSIGKKLSNNKNQIWILWNDEATFIDTSFNTISNLFNWTLSYKTDSEVYEGSYGFVRPNQNNITKHDLLNYKKEIYFKQFKKRKNAILWFVSNCQSKYRIQIALDISKYYPVYIYGKCDPLEGMSQSERKSKYPYLSVNSGGNGECGAGSVCEMQKLNTFKYYLAFENKNCTDYLTEKVWRSLNKHIIPIVCQPEANSYKRLAIPSKSFIHLEKFKFNIQRLTNYLIEMDKRFDLYFDHLKWTYIYLRAVYDGKFTEPHRMCSLCKRLNEYTSNVYYDKIADFFNDKCQS
jgi:glycoprotein 3-alpha-L-fucosyltransferase